MERVVSLPHTQCLDRRQSPGHLVSVDPETSYRTRRRVLRSEESGTRLRSVLPVEDLSTCSPVTPLLVLTRMKQVY